MGKVPVTFMVDRAVGKISANCRDNLKAIRLDIKPYLRASFFSARYTRA